MPLNVIHFHRRPMAGYKSIERLFADIRKAMPAGVNCVEHVCPGFSLGIWRRIKNILNAAKHQGQVNHITGDVHYLALGLDSRRTLLTIHDCASLVRLRGLRRLIFKWLWFDWPIRRSTVVTVISESTRRELLRYVNCAESKIRVVPNCVGSDFIPAPRPFNHGEPVILQVGTGGNKNLERLARALSGLSCRLHVLGQLSPLQETILKDEGIRFANTVNASDADLVKAFLACDMVAFVSTYEGFGLPIIEANATGRPVVTSNILSMPEVAGPAACLVDPLSVASIREGILKVWNNAEYRDQLINAGFKNVRRFTPKAVAEQYCALYEELARK